MSSKAFSENFWRRQGQDGREQLSSDQQIYICRVQRAEKGSECVSCCRVSSRESVRPGRETDTLILHFDFTVMDGYSLDCPGVARVSK